MAAHSMRTFSTLGVSFSSAKGSPKGSLGSSRPLEPAPSSSRAAYAAGSGWRDDEAAPEPEACLFVYES